jgi:hypothetical protein
MHAMRVHSEDLCARLLYLTELRETMRSHWKALDLRYSFLVFIDG